MRRDIVFERIFLLIFLQYVLLINNEAKASERSENERECCAPTHERNFMNNVG